MFGDLTYTVCGTPEYIAPEVIRNEGHNKNIDWWSLGVLLYEMYTGETPFNQQPLQEIFTKLKSPKKLSLSKLKGASPEFISLVEGLLTKDSEKRLGAANDAMDLVKHPFFTGLPWEVVANRKLTPPFKPALRSAEDTRMFDTYYLS